MDTGLAALMVLLASLTVLTALLTVLRLH